MLSYGFNKSHACCYAFIAYQCAYLKYHYPVEFYTALLTVFGDSATKASNYIQDAKQHNIQVLPPDINLSDRQYIITENNDILYGFDSVKGLGSKGIDEILEKRPFLHPRDLVERTVKNKLDKRNVKALCMSGALDFISQNMGSRMQILERLYFFRGDGDDISQAVKDFTKRDMLEFEKELLGVYVSGHPLDDIAKPIDWDEAMKNDGRANGLCLLKDIRRIITKKGDPMAFLTLEFIEQDISGVCFPKLFASPYQFRKGDPEVALGQLLQKNMILKVTGRISTNERDEKSYILDRIDIPVKVNQDKLAEIQALQEELGVMKEVVPTYAAPSFSMGDLG